MMEALCLRLPRKTGQAKIICMSFTQVMFGDDVIDIEGKIEIVPGELAVFATTTGSLPYELFQRTFHAYSFYLGRTVVPPALE